LGACSALIIFGVKDVLVVASLIRDPYVIVVLFL